MAERSGNVFQQLAYTEHQLINPAGAQQSAERAPIVEGPFPAELSRAADGESAIESLGPNEKAQSSQPLMVRTALGHREIVPLLVTFCLNLRLTFLFSVESGRTF